MTQKQKGKQPAEKPSLKVPTEKVNFFFKDLYGDYMIPMTEHIDPATLQPGDCVELLNEEILETKLWDPQNAWIVRITKIDLEHGFRGVWFYNPNSGPEDLCGCYENRGPHQRHTPTGFNNEESLQYQTLMEYRRHPFRRGTFLTLKPPADSEVKQEDVAEVVEFRRTIQWSDQPILVLRRFFWDPEPEQPNEVVWTNVLEVFKTWEDIVDHVGLEPVYVEFVDEDEELPQHLRYMGAGRYFYFRNRLPECNTFNYGSQFRELPESQKLTCLSPMCGAGGLTFGLADAGFLNVTAAFDKDLDAVATFNARYLARHPDGSTKIAFQAESNNLLEEVWQARREIRSGATAPKGPYTEIAESRKRVEDRALIANIASYVEVFKPQLFVFENVTEFARVLRGPEAGTSVTAEGIRDFATPCNLFLAFLIARGYKIVHGSLDAACYGVPQTRRRYFIICV
ncbi:DNA (cytosine-5)-methyltransferase 1, partial [Phlyctochytrium bullatum]